MYKNRAINMILSFVLGSLIFGCSTKEEQRPNILFIMMDDLGYGQFGAYNDTLTTEDFNPFFVHLVDSLQKYSPQKALEFSKAASPTLTKLANEGILFTNAYTSSSLCAPSRLGIATGTMQNKWGVYRNTDCEKAGISPGTHLAENIQALGYKTAHIGKWHIGTRDRQVIQKVMEEYEVPKVRGKELQEQYPEAYQALKNCGYQGSVIEEHNPLNNGFDYYYGYNNWASQFYNSTLVWENFKHAGKQKGYNTDVFTSRAMEFMEEQIDEGNPFYLQLHYHAVHDSLEPRAPDVYFNKFDSDSYTLNNFFAHVYGVDYNLNKMIGFLKQKKAYQNTIIIFTSDNGAMCAGSYHGHKTGSPLPGNAPFSGHKGNYFLGGIRVPLFIHWPGKIENPGESHQLVSTMDILPTAIEVAGGTAPNNIDGTSLLPFIPKREEATHQHLIWAGIHSNKWGYLIQKTTKTHSNEARFAPPAWAILKDGYLLRFTGKLVPGVYLDHMDGRDETIELYNINNDPAEVNNLASELPGKVNAMAKIYFMESKDFKEPVSWEKNKWEELINSKEIFETY